MISLITVVYVVLYIWFSWCNHNIHLSIFSPIWSICYSEAADVYPKEGDDQITASSIGPGEVPPPYQSSPHGGVPMVTCRVCQAMIDITNKREQHVVKCNQCHEATVSKIQHHFHAWWLMSIVLFSFSAHSKCAARQEIRSLSMQLFAHLQKFIATHRLSTAKL